jgi:hypothetical protein
VESASHRNDPNKLWQVVRTINGKRTYLPLNQPITFGSTPVANKKAIANKFMRQYAPPPMSDMKTHKVLRNIHKKFPLDHDYAPFTTQQLDDAIRAFYHSTATGPDGLAPQHLKHLGSRTIEPNSTV